ncbi:hypothetical protein EHS25_004819 [Saitozyma podzolica]|uniref:Uncharacterized protein n=1 Tax=Saitozyma podzolica TaxID=1890683 RepID=A0A427Y314_9TREE|nr:hypothetical protein EHS25_004819 [Saitozyma podzolica]
MLPGSDKGIGRQRRSTGMRWMADVISKRPATVLGLVRTEGGDEGSRSAHEIAPASLIDSARTIDKLIRLRPSPHALVDVDRQPAVQKPRLAVPSPFPLAGSTSSWNGSGVIPRSFPAQYASPDTPASAHGGRQRNVVRLARSIAVSKGATNTAGISVSLRDPVDPALAEAQDEPHTVLVAQDISTTDPSNPQKLDKPLSTTRNFYVQAPLYSLPPNSVHQTYPPQGHADNNHILPHVVFNDSHQGGQPPTHPCSSEAPRTRSLRTLRRDRLSARGRALVQDLYRCRDKAIDAIDRSRPLCPRSLELLPPGSQEQERMARQQALGLHTDGTWWDQRQARRPHRRAAKSRGEDAQQPPIQRPSNDYLAVWAERRLRHHWKASPHPVYRRLPGAGTHSTNVQSNGHSHRPGSRASFVVNGLQDNGVKGSPVIGWSEHYSYTKDGDDKTYTVTAHSSTTVQKQ